MPNTGLVILGIVVLFASGTLSNHTEEDPMPETSASVNAPSVPCVGCAERKRIQEERLSEIELRQAKIELIKHRILSKLGLKSPPQLKTVLPDVLAHGEAFQGNGEQLSNSNGGQRHPNGQSSDSDDYYESKRNVVIFPENGTVVHQCSPSTCFTFQISPQKLLGSVSSAEIWLYKTTPFPTNRSLVVSEIVYEGTVVRRKRILSFEADPPGTGWLKFNIANAVRRWLLKPHLNHSVEISCKGCLRGRVPLSTEERHRPFLVVTTRTSTLNRKRRTVDCTNSSSYCCKEHFHVSFKEIGWDNWILQPSSYTANYCRGSCISDVSIPRYYHTTVLQKYIQSQNSRNEEPKLTLCCTPSKLSSISMIYMDENGVIIQRSLPNMVAEACDCA